ncbi:site-specific integrase [Brevibacterium metallidurans]|uniref:Site-specific integrase n=2 Tax=Brevibacterium metallidurans TaxID=1482676 RepID=A0ABP3C9K8_9MICO
MASIKRRPNGKWRARYRDEAGQEHARHFERKVDAQRWLDEVTASVITGVYVDPGAGKVSLGNFYADWADRQVWVDSTRANADLSIASTGLADFPIKSIRKSHIESWVKRLVGNGLAASTIKTRYVVVRSAFRAAVADRFIVEDPCTGVALPRLRKREAAMRIPTPEQVGRLVACADSGRLSTRKGFGAYVQLAAFAGLRLGEAAGVQVGDIDFLRRELRVRRQVQRDGSTFAVRAPKYGSERTVYLPDALVHALAQHVAKHAPGDDPTRWLFPYREGPLYDNAVIWRWRATRKSAGLTEVRLHDLRHFYASGLIAAGCDVVTVQRALGHESASTTLNTYAHLWPKAEDRTRSAAANLMESTSADIADSRRTRPRKFGSDQGL